MTTIKRGRLSGWGYLPPGGHAGDVLAKVSDVDGHAEWGGVNNINSYGADPTGVEDSGPAIQQALDSGYPVFIPKGTYRYSDGLVIPRVSGLQIRGEGITSVLKYTGSGAAVRFATDTITNIRKPYIGHFMIDATESTATHGLYLANKADGNSFSWGKFEELYIFGSNQAGSIGFYNEGGFYNIFENITSRGWGTGFDSEFVRIRPSTNLYNRCVAMLCLTHGIRVRADVWGLTFIECNVEGDSDYGWLFEGRTASTFPDRHVLINCGSEDDHSIADFYFKDCTNVRMMGGGPGTNSTGNGIYLENTVSSKFTDITFSEVSSLKHALVVDEDSSLNEVSGYSRDTTRLLDAFSIVNNRNTTHFTFGLNGSSPRRSGQAEAVLIRTTTGGTIDVRDPGLYVADASGGDITISLSFVSSQNEGVEVEIKKKPGDTNAVTIDPSSTQTVDATATHVLQFDNECIRLRADATLGGWRVVGYYNPNPHASVASAASLTLPRNVRVASITGTTSITSITATNFKGCIVTLIFADVLTVTDGSNLKLAGNFVTSADDSITLACDGTNWYEVTRSAN